MFATIKSLIPEPRQADQPRGYVGRHRRAEPLSQDEPVSPAPIGACEPEQDGEPETAAA